MVVTVSLLHHLEVIYHPVHHVIHLGPESLYHIIDSLEAPWIGGGGTGSPAAFPTTAHVQCQLHAYGQVEQPSVG